MFIHRPFAFGAGETIFEEMKLDSNVLEKTFTWSCFNLNHTVAGANKPFRVVYVNAKLLRNQSWVRLLFSVS